MSGITENIKWNGPNYCFNMEDRITMKIHPPKKIQLIFHRGAKKLAQPAQKMITNNTKLLDWRENDRAIVSFNNMDEILSNKTELKSIVIEWIEATK
jgi:hypothetical protein